MSALNLAATLDTAGFEGKLRTSPIMSGLKRIRNIKPAFQKGLRIGMLNADGETEVADHSPWTLKLTPDWTAMQKLGEYEQTKRLRAAHTAAATVCRVCATPPPNTTRISLRISRSPTPPSALSAAP